LFRKGWFWGTKALVQKHAGPASARPDLVGSHWQAPGITDQAAWRLAELPRLPEQDGTLPSQHRPCGAACTFGLTKLPMTSDCPAGGLQAALAS